MKTLKNVLLLNAVTSGATGLGLVVLPGFFANLFATSARMPFTGTGIFLVVYGILVFVESRRQIVNANWVRFIALMDAAWVIGSALIVVFQAFDISMFGYLMIGGVGIWVGLMGYLQYIGLRRVALTH
jgi:hypothetical protein